MSKVIVALDYTDSTLANQMVAKLDPKLCKLKVGKALFTTAGSSFVESLQKLGFDIFLDLKFHDIPNTVKTACQACSNLGVYMLTIHTLGGSDMLLAAMEGVDKSSVDRPLVMGVTILTSMTSQNLIEVGINNPVDQQVQLLAGLAKNSGLDGVVCSALEVELIKSHYANSLQLVTPGIRLSSLQEGHVDNDDQHRTMTPKDAIIAGSDYLVIGRPVTQAKDPLAVLEKINTDINFK